MGGEYTVARSLDVAATAEATADWKKTDKPFAPDLALDEYVESAGPANQ
jgi:hypothetical protein